MQMVKTLFLSNSKKTKFYLFVTTAERSINLKISTMYFSRRMDIKAESTVLEKQIILLYLAIFGVVMDASWIFCLRYTHKLV